MLTVTVCCRACYYNPETTSGGNSSSSNLHLSFSPWKSSLLETRKAAGGLGGGLMLRQWSVCSSLVSMVLLPFAGSEVTFAVLEFMYVFLFFSIKYISKYKISYRGSVELFYSVGLKLEAQDTSTGSECDL